MYFVIPGTRKLPNVRSEPKKIAQQTRASHPGDVLIIATCFSFSKKRYKVIVALTIIETSKHSINNGPSSGGPTSVPSKELESVLDKICLPLLSDFH